MRAELSSYWHKRVRDEFAAHCSLTRLEHDLDRVPGLSDEDRAALWLLVWTDPSATRGSRRSADGTGLTRARARESAPR